MIDKWKIEEGDMLLFKSGMKEHESIPYKRYLKKVFGIYWFVDVKFKKGNKYVRA